MTGERPNNRSTTSFPHTLRPRTNTHTPLTHLLGAVQSFTLRLGEEWERGAKKERREGGRDKDEKLRERKQGRDREWS